MMSETQYQKCLSWSVDHGLELDARIERKKVNGLYGMYATEDIPKDTILVSFPIDQSIPRGSDSDYPEEISEDLKIMYTAAIELSKGEDSEHFGCIAMFETLEELQTHSIYFFNDAELQWIQKLNPIVFRMALEQRQRVDRMKESLKELAPQLEEDIILQAILNFFSRVWGGNLGFLPVLDLFNHSDRKGNILIKLDHDTKSGHKARVAYAKGEQIYVSYSRKDMAFFALNYDYFDSEGPHFIDYAKRVIQTVRSELKLNTLKVIAQEYGGQFFQVNGVPHFKLGAKNLFLLENAPSYNLLDYFRKIVIIEATLTKQEIVEQTIYERFLSVIDPFIMAIQVEKFDIKDIPEKVHRFYYMSKKEREMLLSSRSWVFDNITM